MYKIKTATFPPENTVNTAMPAYIIEETACYNYDRKIFSKSITTCT